MQSTLQVYLPYPKPLITQRFGDNANYSYARDGLKGHTAYDWGASYGSKIPNCTPDAYCYSVLNKDNPDPSLYRAVYFIVETESGVYEISYGHCSAIYAQVGQTYQVGDSIALIGNTGDVFDGNHEVTKQERLNGSHAGAHLHGPQIRPVQKVKKITSGKHYLTNESGKYKDPDGFYYEVVNYENGYNGCISLKDFSTEIVATDYKLAQNIVAQTKEIGDKIGTLPPESQQKILPSFMKVIEALKAWLGFY
jgi:hypothetical protein